MDHGVTREHGLAGIPAGDVLHHAMDKIEFGAYRLGESEGVHVATAHGVVDTVEQERQHDMHRAAPASSATSQLQRQSRFEQGIQVRPPTLTP